MRTPHRMAFDLPHHSRDAIFNRLPWEPMRFGLRCAQPDRIKGAPRGSRVEYMTAGSRRLQFVPLSKWFVLLFNCNINYSRAMGNTTNSPPFLNNYAGGPNSVRGFQESELGPRDSNGLPFGGNLLTS